MTYPTMEEVLADFDARREVDRGRTEALGDTLAAIVSAAAVVDHEHDVSVPDWETRVHIDVRGIDSWDDLQPLIDELESKGFRANSFNDQPDSLFRMINLHGPDGCTAVLVAWLAKEGAACKVVDTGEMEPVLKFVCPGDADYPTEEVA